MPSDNQIYATSFCNFGHNLKTGRPVAHECYILPPTMLAAERAGDTDRANTILANTDFKRHGMVRGRPAPLVANEGNVYDKPRKYHKTHGLYTTKLQDAIGDSPEIFDVWFDGGDAALPYGFVTKFKNKPLYHVYIYMPGYSADFDHAVAAAHVFSKDDAFKVLRKAKYNEVF